MNPYLARFLFFLGSFSLTLGASLASIQGGFDITLAQIFTKVPLVAWLLATGNGVIAAIDSKIITKRDPEAS